MKSDLINGLITVVFFLATLTAPLHAEQPSVLVEIGTVKEQTVSITLPTFGVIQPDSDKVIGVSLAHSGIINKVWCRLGQQVKQDDLLLEIETAPAARMDYLQAQSAVDFAQQELTRKQELYNEQLATKTDVAAARKALSDAQTSMTAQQAQGKGETRTQIHAPIDGVITELNIKQGQRVQAETTALLLSPQDHLVAQLGVEPEEAGHVTSGLKVVVSSVFSPDKIAHGQVQEVHAMINPVTRLVDVIVPLSPEQTSAFIPGIRITGLIHLAEQRALTVPQSAILEDNEGHYLFRVDDNKVKKVYVTVVLERENFAAISSGVQMGEKVVVTGNYELQDGMDIRVQSQ